LFLLSKKNKVISYESMMIKNSYLNYTIIILLLFKT
jgi:hypothetical protein